MQKNKFTIQKIIARVTFLVLLLIPTFTHASFSNGTIDTSNKLTKICKDVACTTYGNVNFAPTLNVNTPGAVAISITDTGITGHAWGDEIGWINMSPTGSGVTVNPTTGLLSGKAFSTSGSWINFSATGQSVTLVDNGSGSNFSGYAWVSGAGGGWMKFDCVSVGMCIKTDWRSIPNRPIANTSGSGGIITNSNQNLINSTVDYCPNIIGVQNNDSLCKEVKSNKPKTLLNIILNNLSFPKIVRTDTNQNTDNNFESPKVLKDKNSTQNTDDKKEVREIFPFNSKVYNEINEKSCVFCIVYRRDIGLSIHKDQEVERYILKWAFVPKKWEVRIPISRTPGNGSNLPEQSDVDLTSVIITVVAAYSVRKVIIGLLAKIFF